MGIDSVLANRQDESRRGGNIGRCGVVGSESVESRSAGGCRRGGGKRRRKRGGGSWGGGRGDGPNGSSKSDH